jgi:uncharacterized protein (TIRG00374 family)
MNQGMTSEIRFTKRTAALLLTAGLFFFLLYLYFFVPFDEFLATIQHANLFYYLLALGCLFFSMAFYSLTWQGLLRIVSVNVPFLRTFQYIWIGSFVDILVPAESVSGDISRVYLVSKESNENAGRVVASVAGHRLLSGFVLFGGFLISAVYFILVSSPTMLVKEVIVIILVCSIVFQGLLFYLCTRRHATEKLVNWLVNLLARLSRGRWHFDRLRKSGEKMLTAFHDGIAAFGKEPRKLVLPVLFSVAAWFFDLFIVVLVFLSLGSFGVTVPLSLILVVYSIGTGLQAVPLGIPADIGVFEIVMTSIYAFFGVQMALSAVATLLTRFITLWAKLLIGGVCVQWVGIKVLKGKAPSNQA